MAPRIRFRWRHAVGPMVALTLFTAALLALHHLLAELSLERVMAEIHAISHLQLAMAMLCAAGSYFALTNYDQLGVRYLGARLRRPAVATVSFCAYALGHNLGFSLFSGGAVRYRGYSALGLNAGQVATIVAFSTATFTLGGALLLGIALLAEPPATLARLGIGPRIATGAGGLMLAIPTLYLAWAIAGPPHLAVRGWRLKRPTPAMAAAQIGLASVDLLLAASVVFLLLPPGSPVGYLQYVGAYLVAMGAGVVSGVPGGAGVFETLLLLLLPQLGAASLIGALVVFRVIYYLIPLLAALLVLGVREAGATGWALTPGRARAGYDWLARVIPPAMTALVFLSGVMLLASGGLPELSDRMRVLSQRVPLALIETSHMINSVIGVLFLVLARSLLDRTRAAFNLTLGLLVAGVVVSLLKGLDYEEATALTVAAVLLWSTRRAFDRETMLLDQVYSPAWTAAVIGVVSASGFLAYLATRHAEYSASMWWQFAADAHEPRILRAFAVAAITALTFSAVKLLRHRPPAATASSDSADVNRIVAASPESIANAVFTGDKRVLLDADRSAFVMYQFSGTSCVALGDPIGSERSFEPLIWQFRDYCSREHVRPVFYEVTEHHLPLYLDCGFTLEKLGEEGLVPLQGFSLAGPARAELRQARNRSLRNGNRFEIVPRRDYAQVAEQLQAISDEWLAAKRVREKGFSLGRFDHRYLAHFDIALVRRADRPVAFANVWRGAHQELSVDLMRFNDGAPAGTMDFLLIELMLWGAEQGFEQFSLGMAPLAGLETHRLAPLWHKLGSAIFELGEPFYNFEGLRRYKEKFRPVWKARYLASTGTLTLPKTLLDVAILISGGVGGLVAR